MQVILMYLNQSQVLVLPQAHIRIFVMLDAMEKVHALMNKCKIVFVKKTIIAKVYLQLTLILLVRKNFIARKIILHVIVLVIITKLTLTAIIYKKTKRLV